MFKRSKRYHEGKRPQKTWKSVVLGIVAVCLIFSGLYMLFLLRSADVKPLSQQKQEQFVPEQIAEKQIIIPKIAVKVDIFEGDKSVLEKGAWHRVPENGDPDKGGNFVVSAHRFVMGGTPGQTKQRSPFYNIEKLSENDTIFIDWQHKRHEYKITKVYKVKPTQVEIEAPSETAKLTLYSCTLGGSADGRVVIEAEPIN